MLRITLLSGEELTSLKQRLHQQHGLPPRFRQRLLHEGSTLDDDVQLDSAMDLQLLIVAFSEVSEGQQQELDVAASDGMVAKARCSLQSHNRQATSPEILKLVHLFCRKQTWEPCFCRWS